MVNNLPAMQETQVRSLAQKDPLEEGMAAHSSILAWKIPWAEEPGRLQSTGSQRVEHNWVTKTHTHARACAYLRTHPEWLFFSPKMNVHPLCHLKMLSRKRKAAHTFPHNLWITEFLRVNFKSYIFIQKNTQLLKIHSSVNFHAQPDQEKAAPSSHPLLSSLTPVGAPIVTPNTVY